MKGNTDGASGRPAEPTVSVVIPTLNEGPNLPHVLAGLPPGLDEVIVVDGGSTDDTVAIAQRWRPGIRVIGQSRRGKGNALACGFGAAGGDIIVMIDADGSTDPAEIPLFIEALVDGADFVKGTRYAHGGGSADLNAVRDLGNRALSRTVNRIFGTEYTDLCYGYAAFWRDCLGALALVHDEPSGTEGEPIWGDGFEIETLMNIRVAVAGLKVVEVPSFERVRRHGTSNLNPVSDGLRIARTIMTERRRLRRSDSLPHIPQQRRPDQEVGGPAEDDDALAG